MVAVSVILQDTVLRSRGTVLEMAAFEVAMLVKTPEMMRLASAVRICRSKMEV